MKKVLLTFAAVLFSAAILAQASDFSGSWKLNTSKSTLGAEFSMAPRDVIIMQNGMTCRSKNILSFRDRNSSAPTNSHSTVRNA